MKLSESTILVIASVLIGIAAFFALIGLTTPKWITDDHGLWNCHEVCSPSAAVLAILSFLLLVTSAIILVIHLLRLFPKNLRIIPLCLVIIGTLFLLIAMLNYLRHFNYIGYSFHLIATAQAFGFIASVLLAFWFGMTMKDKISTTTTTRVTVSSPTVIVPSARVL